MCREGVNRSLFYKKLLKQFLLQVHMTPRQSNLPNVKFSSSKSKHYKTPNLNKIIGKVLLPTRRHKTNELKGMDMGTRILARALRYKWLPSYNTAIKFENLTFEDKLTLHVMAVLQRQLTDNEKFYKEDVWRFRNEVLEYARAELQH